MARQPFDDKVCSFLNSLSSALLRNPVVRDYPDIVTFAFFCRKANITKLAEFYSGRINSRIGRGIAFHVAPSNVPINFAYTLVAGLLAGNACIVKASSKDFPQTRIIAQEINNLEKDLYPELKGYTTVVIYNRDNVTATNYFSSVCDVRVIWGGDATVKEIRHSELSPRSFDVTFADRYSLCVINAEQLLELKDISELIHAFYNDTYFFDQNACTSPRLIYWVGDEDAIGKAQTIFWAGVQDYIKNRYTIEPVIAVDKYMQMCRSILKFEGASVNHMNDNRIIRVELKNLDKSIVDYRSAGGFFLEYADRDINALAGIVDEKYQTITYYGEAPETIKNLILKEGLYGIDRIVPIGKSADFNLLWDGYDLIETLSRTIVNILPYR